MIPAGLSNPHRESFSTRKTYACLCFSAVPKNSSKELLKLGTNMGSAYTQRFIHSLKSGKARNSFLSTLKQGLVTFAVSTL